ncbi:saccharopine dehydrogenase [Pseudoflavitalea sp. X16]|uniref:saccharopine dehydrogenase C-terminal domain-containing protein n=1 Tax=Paraflavitalea devenefica TaxID=2716334 RepID=UPI00141F7A43|nr:saccharopine dehydrogenase C-terminal domain-containing protein [Paraflavitalea devenefica]NII26863.1 saccharopine dehydrogenase [Paraflavitalea devenefica]
MKHIVVFGAGKSATCLIEYLIKTVQENEWQLHVVDSNLDLALSKTNLAARTRAYAINVEDDVARYSLITIADIVISLLPPSLHYLVAKDCVAEGIHLLTASYVDEKISALAPQIKDKGLLFLCEMGLDPGIDHMSAVQLIHRIKAAGGRITSFKSHCGGLVAPESDDNPWHYKISWNPRNVVLAGKAGAVFKENQAEIHMPYEQLFDANRVVNIPELGYLAWYPNRDSLGYIPIYELEEAATFIRTTLRYPEFCFGWKNVIELKLTDETEQYNTDGMTLQQFFQQHFNTHGFSEWIEKQLTARFAQTKQLLEKLQQLLEAEQEADENDRKALQDFMMVDDHGQLMDINLNEVKTKAAATVAGQMHEANLSMKQLFFLGMDDDKTVINKGMCSTAEVLQFALETKLALGATDKDMIVMLHEIGYETADGVANTINSTLIVKGQDPLHTAMAKTVGLPLGIAAKLILQGKIQLTGLHIPILAQIYEPVLEELEKHGIIFFESIS